jgi:hypothetical protein
MGTLNAFYVRASGDSTPLAIQQRFPLAGIEPGEVFVGVMHDNFEPPHKDLALLSEELATDVIWLSFQSVVDAFEFHHWQKGKALRSLVFGCYAEERTWERVEGEPEAWEREAFFDPKNLRYPMESAKTDQEKHEFERIWRDAELMPGRTEPNIDSREAAWKCAQHYCFPGWS